MLKALFVALVSGMALGVLEGAALFEEPFAIPPNNVGSVPAGWTPEGKETPNDFISEGNLVYPGLAVGSAGSWKHDGSNLQAYFREFSAAEWPAGQALYFSYLLKVESLGRMNMAGPTSGVVMLTTSDLTAPKNGGVCALSLRKDATIANGYNLGFSPAFRGVGNKEAHVIGLDVHAETGGTVFHEGETLLIVVEYSYTSPASSTAKLWVNPDPSTLGGATPPSPTVSLQSTKPLSGFPVRRILINSLGNTSIVQGAVWHVDALRIGNTWADVTPSAGPVSFAGMGQRSWNETIGLTQRR
jgi:hypothetical protein